MYVGVCLSFSSVLLLVRYFSLIGDMFHWVLVCDPDLLCFIDLWLMNSDMLLFLFLIYFCTQDLRQEDKRGRTIQNDIFLFVGLSFRNGGSIRCICASIHYRHDEVIGHHNGCFICYSSMVTDFCICIVGMNAYEEMLNPSKN